MADAALTLIKSEQPNKASFDFNGKEYEVLYTQIDFLKAMNVYGQMEKLKNTNQNNWIENCEIAVEYYNEALRIIKEMIGSVALMEIVESAKIRVDLDSVSQVLGVCVLAITNRVEAEKKAALTAEMAKLDNV